MIGPFIIGIIVIIHLFICLSEATRLLITFERHFKTKFCYQILTVYKNSIAQINTTDMGHKMFLILFTFLYLFLVYNIE